MAPLQMWRDITVKLQNSVISSNSNGGFPVLMQLMSKALSAEAREMQKSLSFTYMDTAFVSSLT